MTDTNKTLDMSKFDHRLAATYSKDKNKEQHYDEWASSYEHDLVNDLGYIAHKDASEIFANYVVNRSTRILDVACGTGLVGEYLQQMGYTSIDGVDFSEEMLKISRHRKVYQQLWQQDFTNSASLSNLYEALICVGMFSYSIPKIEHMHHVVNCVVPGGLCVITVNGAAWLDLDLGAEVKEELDRHNYTLVANKTAGYIENEGIDSRVLVIRR